MAEEEEPNTAQLSEREYLFRISRDLKTLLTVMSKFTFAMAQAESEIPENMRRFMNYMHDVHDVTYMYEERGLPVPKHQLREMERCDDRYRQLLKEQYEGGTFERVRSEMAKDTENRWDHSRQLTFHGHKHKENSHGQSTVEKESERPSGEEG